VVVSVKFLQIKNRLTYTLAEVFSITKESEAKIESRASKFPSIGTLVVDLLTGSDEVIEDKVLLLLDGLHVTRPNIDAGDTVAAENIKN